MDWQVETGKRQINKQTMQKYLKIQQLYVFLIIQKKVFPTHCLPNLDCNAPVLLMRDGAGFPESFLEGLPKRN